jgi:hypothetical protein
VQLQQKRIICSSPNAKGLNSNSEEFNWKENGFADSEDDY